MSGLLVAGVDIGSTTAKREAMQDLIKAIIKAPPMRRRKCYRLLLGECREEVCGDFVY